MSRTAPKRFLPVPGPNGKPRPFCVQPNPAYALHEIFMSLTEDQVLRWWKPVLQDRWDMEELLKALELASAHKVDGFRFQRIEWPGKVRVWAVWDPARSGYPPPELLMVLYVNERSKTTEGEPQ